VDEIIKSISWTTVLATTISNGIMALFILVLTRYTNHLLEKIDRNILKIRKEEKPQ